MKNTDVKGWSTVTIFYPDISSFQAGISLKGAVAAACKVTEGAGYFNPDYNRARANAASHGTFFFAYHFLSAGSAAAQAGWCLAHAGKTPVMLDFEPSSSRPGMTDCLAFIDTYRRMGGVIHLVYLPHWYWQQIGSPSLTPLMDRGMLLVSSNYTTYSDGGPGWTQYGGMSPTVWQYSDNTPFNGFNVDFNAYKGTLAQFKSIAITGKLPAPPAPRPAADHIGNPVQGIKVDARTTQADVSWDPAVGAKSYTVNLWRKMPKMQVRHKVTTVPRVTFHRLRRGNRYKVTVLANPASLKARRGARAHHDFTTKR
jgi:GH25 family lysozyme M1 (1,4-beta-N-acetylmuramidase)